MPSRNSRTLRLSVLGVLVILVATAAVVYASSSDTPTVRSRNVGIDVQDGPRRDQPLRVDATVYLPERTPAPAVLVSPGFGGTKDSVSGDARELAERGFVALAYSPRGFGRTGGRIGLNSPDYEVADASGLVSWLARQPEVSRDGPNDPKVGVTGASYGGALSLLLAGTDRRVDAIAPVITYNDLGQALLPNAATRSALPGTAAAGADGADGVFKQAWAGLLFASGAGGGGGGLGGGRDAPEPGTDTEDDAATSGGTGADTGTGAAGSGAASGALSGGLPGAERGGRDTAAGPCGNFRPEVCAAYTRLATTGRADAATTKLLQRLSPASVTGRITVPTMLVQGEQDTLFGLDQSDATARQITAAGGKVKVVWYTGGHDGGGPGPKLRASIGAWFDYHLRGVGTDPGTGFAYDVQGSLRARGTPTVRTVVAPGYPAQAQRRQLPLSGPPQPVVNPPGGKPGAVSSLPGLTSVLSGSSRLAGRVAIDLPGQTARFVSAPLDAQLLVTGSARVRLTVSAPRGAPAGGVLFAKLYDVSQDGTQSLPGSAVAPIRLPALPADGSPVTLTVTLPGIVAPVESGHRLQLAVTTTDQGYSVPVAPAAYRVGLASADLAVPVVPGTASGTGPPAGTLIAIGGVLLVALAVVLATTVRRRRESDVDDSLAEVPLVIENLAKSYPGGVRAVDGLSFRVEHGQVLGLLGPNGAGKTTALRMLMGLITPSEGTIRVFGHRVRDGAPVLSRIGCFVEGSGFLPHLSGAENLRLYWASTGRARDEAHFTEALEIAGLGTAIERRVRTYSQGMRQRLAIAQAMLGLPELLVLDEPTNGLDPPQIHQMREVLRRYADTGRTVVVSSHLLAEVEQTCSHVVVMHRGRLVAAGEVADITASGQSEATFVVDRPEDAAEVLRGLAGVSEVDVEGDKVHAELNGTGRPAAVGALVAAGVGVAQAGPRRRLEDAFLRLVGEES